MERPERDGLVVGPDRPRTIYLPGPEGLRPVDIYTPEGFALLADLWTRANWQQKFSYEVTWLGMPIIQLPEDMVMLQEVIWRVRPEVIIETGTAHGGSAIFYASLLELLGRGRVISIDIEIRRYNRLAILAHPLSRRLTLIEGSSTDPAVVERVQALLRPGERVLVALDSNHSRAHVRRELDLYAPLVSPGSYLIVFDGVMEVLTGAPNGAPHWAEDSPAAAVRDFLAAHPEFVVDPYYNRLRVTYCPGGFLRRRTPEELSAEPPGGAPWTAPA